MCPGLRSIMLYPDRTNNEELAGKRRHIMRTHHLNHGTSRWKTRITRRLRAVTTALAFIAIVLFASGSAIAGDEGTETVGQTTEDSEMVEGRDAAAAADIDANLDLFDQMERAPGVYTDNPAPAAEIDANLDLFDQMERAPGLYTGDS